MKTCYKCTEELPDEDFYTRPDGALYTQCKACQKIRRQNSRKSPAFRISEQHRQRWHKYGITMVEYGAMLKKQGGICTCCGSDHRLCVDHCHVTGAVRGLLCNNCNLALGCVNDSPRILQNLIKYLRRTNQAA